MWLLGDLKVMHTDNEENLVSPGRKPKLQEFATPPPTQRAPPPLSQRDNDDGNYARGGHGIFGDPKVW